MTTKDPIAILARRAAAFGAENARAKAGLLAQILHLEHVPARDLRRLHDILCFLTAYPDDATVLRRVEKVSARLREWGASGDTGDTGDTGYPGSVIRTCFSLPVLLRLQRLFPECLEIDWEETDSADIDRLASALGLLVSPGECQGLDDVNLDLEDWFAAARSPSMKTDLEFLLALFTRSDLDAAALDLIFETCEVPIRYRLATPGTASCEIRWPVDRVCFQKQDIPRERQPLAAQIRRAISDGDRVPLGTGKAVIDLATLALSTRNLEIRTLTYANPKDVWLCNCGRGVQFALMGVVPTYRDPLECHYCVLVLKNGVPIAYGPATVWLGCCEIGLNLFEEFRGAEIRFIYPQFMRAIHHVLGARYFFLTAYGMGENNPAAIRTGAFWFYRKMGFLASNPKVEALALEEEKNMGRSPGYRSSVATLRKLSHTEAHFDLSGGECHKLDLSAIGLRQSQFLAALGADRDRARAEEQCIQRAAHLLQEDDIGKASSAQRHAWRLLAPILCMIPDLPKWSAQEKKRLLRIVRAKGKPSEAGVDRVVCRHARFREALFALGEPDH